MKTYKIVRFFQDELFGPVVVREGLPLELAQDHCSSPESSSTTAKSRVAQLRTAQCGPWFEGYEEE